MPMEPITFKLTEADIAAGNELWRRNRVKPWALLILFAVSCGLMTSILMIAEVPFGPLSILLIVVGAVVFLGATYVLSKRSSRRTALRYFRQSRAIQQEVALSWTDTNLALKQPDGQQDRPWSDSKFWAEDDTVLVLLSVGPMFTAIPKRVLTPDQLDDIRACLARAGVPRARLVPL